MVVELAGIYMVPTCVYIRSMHASAPLSWLAQYVCTMARSSLMPGMAVAAAVDSPASCCCTPPALFRTLLFLPWMPPPACTVAQATCRLSARARLTHAGVDTCCTRAAHREHQVPDQKYKSTLTSSRRFIMPPTGAIAMPTASTAVSRQAGA